MLERGRFCGRLRRAVLGGNERVLIEGRVDGLWHRRFRSRGKYAGRRARLGSDCMDGIAACDEWMTGLNDCCRWYTNMQIRVNECNADGTMTMSCVAIV